MGKPQNTTQPRPSTVETAGPAPPPFSRNRAERLAFGRSLRRNMPRSSHAGTADTPRDGVALLKESNQGRLPHLVPIRYGRMLHSPFAFMRGAASVMARDLGRQPHWASLPNYAATATSMTSAAMPAPRGSCRSASTTSAKHPGQGRRARSALIDALPLPNRHARLAPWPVCA